MLRIALAATLAFTASPLLAQSLSETHVKVAQPAGKTVDIYRPVNSADCRAAAHRHHQAGKMALPVAQSDACAEIAARKAARAAAAR